MNRTEKKNIKHRQLVKTRLHQFYSSHEYLISSAIQYADQEIRSKLIAIEDLFSPELNHKQRELKKKKFHMPVSYHKYLEFKNMLDWVVYYRNKEFHNAVKNLRHIHERQWFRNLEIFNMLIQKLQEYLKELNGDRSLKRLCRSSGYSGFQADLFRKKRLKEARIILEEYKNIHSMIKKDIFVNDIEEYITGFVDFFVQCRFRLDKLVENVSASIQNPPQLPNKKIILKDIKADLSLELPRWSRVSKFG